MATTYTREDERSRLLTNSVTNGIPSQSSLNHSTSTFKFRSSWQFLGLRVLLRILSFWCPRSSCWLERVLYPFLVNSLLNLVSVIVLLQIINLYQFDYEILGGQKQYAIVYIILSVVASCSHIAGIFYFGSRDVEDNMTNLILDGHCRRFLENNLCSITSGWHYRFLSYHCWCLSHTFCFDLY